MIDLVGQLTNLLLSCMLTVRHHYHCFITKPHFLIFFYFSPIAQLHVAGKAQRWRCRVVARLARYALEQPENIDDDVDGESNDGDRESNDDDGDGDYDGDSNVDEGDGDCYSDYDDYHVDEDVDGTLGGMYKPPRALDVVEV